MPALLLTNSSIYSRLPRQADFRALSPMGAAPRGVYPLASTALFGKSGDSRFQKFWETILDGAIRFNGAGSDRYIKLTRDDADFEMNDI